jgi:hypothetical protein
VVRRAPKHIEVAGSIGSNGTVSDVVVIPRKNILRIERLK